MKELENINKDEIGIHSEVQNKKEIKLLGQQRKIPGLKLWEFNVKTKELKEAEFVKQDLYIRSLNISEENLQIKHKVITKDDCIYFQALNKKSAIKKIIKSVR